jgi:hypothetical protein
MAGFLNWLPAGGFIWLPKKCFTNIVGHKNTRKSAQNYTNFGNLFPGIPAHNRETHLIVYKYKQGLK